MYVRKNSLKEKLKQGKIVTGMEIWLRDARMIELLGHAGFDFAHIENEHVAHNWETVENLVRTAELVGLTPLFRCEQCFNGEPPVNQIIKALKCGAQIIMVPQINTPEEAEKAVAAVKYTPIGKRGIATCDRGSREIIPREVRPTNLKDFVKEANGETMVWAIIETPKALENIDAILDVDGIDAVGVGHQDYAIAAGLSSDSGPEIDKARERVWQAAQRKGKHMWWTTHDPKIAKQYREKGVKIILLGVDVIHMNSHLRNLTKQVKGPSG
jgi:4-hydroxy-2-oxoheptanedioate aldolase